jgi:hypothetical protein
MAGCLVTPVVMLTVLLTVPWRAAVPPPSVQAEPAQPEPSDPLRLGLAGKAARQGQVVPAVDRSQEDLFSDRPLHWNGDVTGLSRKGWPVVAGRMVPLSGISQPFPDQIPAFRWLLYKQGDHLTCERDPASPGYVCITSTGRDVARAALAAGLAVADGSLHCDAGRPVPDPQGFCRLMHEAMATKHGQWLRREVTVYSGPLPAAFNFGDNSGAAAQDASLWEQVGY